MKIKLKKSGIIIGIILLIAIAAFIIAPNLIITLIGGDVKEDPASAYSLSFGDTESLGVICGDQREIIEKIRDPIIPEIEIRTYRTVKGQTVPLTPQAELFCLDYDTDFWTPGAKYSVSTLTRYGSVRRYRTGNPHTIIPWEETFYSRGEHIETEYDGEVTYPWLITTREIDLIAEKEMDLAYILTSPDIGHYNDEKQVALWASKGQVPANDLYKEAEQYEEYYQATQVERGSTDLPDINVKGSVDDIKVMSHYDEAEGTITIGPINLTYINKNNDDVAFSGISNMYFRGYNLEGEKINNNIKIEKFIDDKGTHTLSTETYFTPEKDSFVDHGEQVYPDGTGSFYVVIKNPNVGKTSADEDFISELALCIRFKWMTIFDAIASNMDAYEYTVNWFSHGKDKNYYYDCGGEHCSGHFDYKVCRRKSRLDEGSLQSVLQYRGGARELFTRTVIIKGFDITMDLGGSVWEDGVATKESIADGVNSTPEQNGQKIDKPLEGIKVNLWAYNEKLWGQEGKFVTYTYTNENGNYMFENLNSLLKYYVTFEYNGQQYLPTDYLKATNEKTYSSVKDMVDAGEYSTSEAWKTTSKGTEIETDRNTYDQRFAQIGSSPTNYKSTDSLKSGQLVNGYNEAFSEYSLMGFVLGEDGNYSIDEDLALIDGFYTVEDGKIVETDELQEGRISKAIKQYMEEYEKSEKDRLRTELDAEFNKKINDWNKTCNSYIGNPEVQNLEGQRASGIRTLQKQKATRLEYIEELTIVPDYDEMMKEIYEDIAGKDTELWRKLQFIEDCKIKSSTRNTSGTIDLYPVYDDIYINRNMEDSTNSGMDNESKKYDTIEEKQNDNYNQTIIRKGGYTYKPIYGGQFFVNQGLWRRQVADMSLRKDVYRSTVNVNGKTVVYKYDTRSQMTDAEKIEYARLRAIYEQDRTNLANYNNYTKYKEQIENKYWEIQGKVLSYAEYYGARYSRELYASDYYFPGDINGNNKLEVYITYKIEIRNQSESILTRIDEIVDYYDDTYTFQQDKSWMMYYGDRSNNNDDISVADQDFYDIMVEDKNVGSGKYRSISANEGGDRASDFNSEFAAKGYKTLYIDSLKQKERLQSGEEIYLYLTFKVNGEGDKLATEKSSTENGKQNIVEINGYSTFYRDGTQLPNNVTISGENTVAGVLDHDSTPGNFRAEYLNENGKYEHKFEDDTDRSRGVNVYVEDESKVIRKTSGTAWEDKRDTNVAGAMIGNGIRESGESGIGGIQVELREVILDEKGNPTVDANGNVTTTLARIYAGNGNFKDAKTTTNSDGSYLFEGIVPGDYIVRFTYGGSGNSNAFYNGQDYKSTSYQIGINQNGRTDVAKESEYHYYGYTDTNTQNVSGSYGYDIYKVDTYEKNVSDAKDLWAYREAVNNYSKNGVTYDKAALLNDNETGHDETKMIAETGVIRVEGEYNRQNTSANKNENGDRISNENYTGTSTGKNTYQGTNGDNDNTYNGSYHIKNVDLGLVERPKAQLELNKEVANVKITLANQTVLIDAVKQMNDVQWVNKKEYNIKDFKNSQGIYQTYGISNYKQFREKVAQRVADYVIKNKGLININMDEEIMHGATIQITYDMKVTNAGEIDYDDKGYYYLGQTPNRSTIVKTSADVVLDYVENNLQFRADSNQSDWQWQVISNNEITGNGYVNSNVAKELKDYNTIIRTTGLSNKLTPGEIDETTLILSQLITAQNTQDDKCYDNIAEIVQISNDVGRRMATSVQGNQNPKEAPQEVDSSKAEEVKIIPPFGIGNIVVYIALSIGILAILTTGIIFIKKKVLK